MTGLQFSTFIRPDSHLNQWISFNTRQEVGYLLSFLAKPKIYSSYNNLYLISEKFLNSMNQTEVQILQMMSKKRHLSCNKPNVIYQNITRNVLGATKSIFSCWLSGTAADKSSYKFSVVTTRPPAQKLIK